MVRVFLRRLLFLHLLHNIQSLRRKAGGPARALNFIPVVPKLLGIEEDLAVFEHLASPGNDLVLPDDAGRRVRL